MNVELTALATYLAEGVELIESKPFSLLEGAQLLLHLFNNQNLGGRVLRADAAHALVEVGEKRWWLDRQSSGRVHRWIVRAPEGAAGDSSLRHRAEMS
jgi:hypothetical protein